MTTSDLCDAPIIGRDGKPLGFNCNLDKDHMCKCAQVLWSAPTATAMVDVVPLVLSGGPDGKA